MTVVYVTVVGVSTREARAVFVTPCVTRVIEKDISRKYIDRRNRVLETRTVAALQPAENIDTIRVIDRVNAMNAHNKHMIDVIIDGKMLQMEIDSGAPCGIVSVNTLRKIKPRFALEKTNRQFVSYTGHQILCISCIPVKVTIGHTTRELNLFVVKGPFDALFGREWISHFVHKIDFKKLFSAPETVHMISTAVPSLTQGQKAQLDQLLAKYKDIFSSTAGTLTGPPISLHLKPDEHPIPKTEHIFSQLKGAKFFCHLDITDAYSHLVLNEESSHVLTLNTPTHGIIRPVRAVYGSSSIPAIWQRKIETVLQGLENVKNFFDDMVLYAENFESLLKMLDLVLQRLREHGLHLNRDKCVFATSAIKFLGHKVDSQGIHKSDKHVQAIRNAPKPSTPEELQLFLGKATYYSFFIPDLSTRNCPLRNMLLVKPYKWTPTAEKAYDNIKNVLVSPQVLMPYDPTRSLLLATDASKTGLGAVLSHRLDNGQERPIAYASRTMSATEQRYPQINKEALVEAGQDLARSGYKAPEANYRLGSNCLVLEHRVVIPPAFRETILKELHTAHLGIVKIKGLARSFVFWPGIDSDIEGEAKTCSECAKNAHKPPKYRRHHWEYPKSPTELQSPSYQTMVRSLQPWSSNHFFEEAVLNSTSS
ncbi:uncharacterized protein LOC112456811 [Temnothorax curvispinosus]|uniref:RNA-directed DNA polymerase n=1 Tax=Temnothorax curvispinosus TaxID=300111 RepID=A0A6J1PZP8_9HYME|nr:uncharacterized protein LOC112456811 [Temnothorax curvispinosus]